MGDTHPPGYYNAPPSGTGPYVPHLHSSANASTGNKPASPTQEMDANRRAGGFYIPFGRNVPGRSTIQHVPASETRDRLALERPDQWSRPLVRHPGTAAHMDQKTTLADLYNQVRSTPRNGGEGRAPLEEKLGFFISLNCRLEDAKAPLTSQLSQ